MIWFADALSRSCFSEMASGQEVSHSRGKQVLSDPKIHVPTFPCSRDRTSVFPSFTIHATVVRNRLAKICHKAVPNVVSSPKQEVSKPCIGQDMILAPATGFFSLHYFHL